MEGNDEEAFRLNRDKVERVVHGQLRAQSSSFSNGQSNRVAIVSNSARYFMSPCINGAAATGCGGNVDLIHYKTPTYEAIGTEMADNGFVFDKFGVKALHSFSCLLHLSHCKPERPVFRWRSDLLQDHATSTSATAFDDTPSYAFKGVRYYLFSQSAVGRVALYSKKSIYTGDYMDTVDYDEGGAEYGSAKLLGYCHMSPQTNAAAPLVRLRSGNNRVTSVDPLEVSAFIQNGYQVEKTLCYTSSR